MSYKQQFFLTLSVGIVLLALLVGELSAIRGGQTRLALALEEIAALRHEREALDATRTLADRTAEDRRTLRGLFIPRDGVVAFLKRLEDLEKRSGTELVVETLSAAPLSPEAPFDDVALRFTATGDFRHVVQLLALVGSLPSAAMITSVRFETTPAAEGASAWRAIVFLRALKERDVK